LCTLPLSNTPGPNKMFNPKEGKKGEEKEHKRRGYSNKKQYNN
jgi:hypothetical protein